MKVRTEDAAITESLGGESTEMTESELNAKVKSMKDAGLNPVVERKSDGSVEIQQILHD